MIITWNLTVHCHQICVRLLPSYLFFPKQIYSIYLKIIINLDIRLSFSLTKWESYFFLNVTYLAKVTLSEGGGCTLNHEPRQRLKLQYICLSFELVSTVSAKHILVLTVIGQQSNMLINISSRQGVMSFLRKRWLIIAFSKLKVFRVTLAYCYM